VPIIVNKLFIIVYGDYIDEFMKLIPKRLLFFMEIIDIIIIN